jgi:acyl-Coa thioesterase superfamily protein/acyl-CoA thioesterase superfamily protein
MDGVALATEPLFTRDGEVWHPHAEAGGPFGGLHGGAVSGLLIAELERAARELGLGPALGAQVLLLRPAPMAPLAIRTEVLRKGGRAGALEAVLTAEGKLMAKAMASFVAPLAVTGAPAAPPRPFDPSDLPVWSALRFFSHKTLFDAQDIRDDGKCTKWGRLVRPIAAFASPLADVFAIADNGTPFYLTAQQIMPRWAFPNIDISVHVSRPPVGGWIGVEAFSDWRPDGMGLTDSKLYDTQGYLGRACQTVVLTPMS